MILYFSPGIYEIILLIQKIENLVLIIKVDSFRYFDYFVDTDSLKTDDVYAIVDKTKKAGTGNVEKNQGPHFVAYTFFFCTINF